MLNPDLFTFLKELKQNNHKEWFDENRQRYTFLREHFIHYVSLMVHELSEMDPALGSPDPRKTVFRINRDVRFSKDKSPYKTNMGAYIAPGGKNSFMPGYYFHIEPDASMIAGGMYMPPPDMLKKVRKEIFENADEFREIIEDADFIHTFGQLEGEMLKTAPQGFPKDHPDIGLLRYKSYTVFKEVPEKLLSGPDSLNHVMGIFRVMKPLNDFLRHAAGL